MYFINVHIKGMMPDPYADSELEQLPTHLESYKLEDLLLM